MSAAKSSYEIKAELKAAEARYRELVALAERVEQQLQMVRDERDELLDAIPRLREQLAATELAEDTAMLRPVRVLNGWRRGEEQWRFVKATPKRIYLRDESGLRDEFWERDGTSSYRGTIHPDDLAWINAEAAR